MKEKGKPAGRKKAVILAVCLIAAAVAVFLAVRKANGSRKEEGTAYVDRVAVWMGGGVSDLSNRYTGVVVSQDTWSVPQNSESEIREILVEPGQEVQRGTPLLTYDVDKFETDLTQARIDMERLNNELTAAKATAAQLAKEKKKAASSEQANYTIQIQEQQLAVKQKELDIESKQADIDKLSNQINNATVTSEIDGVVKSVNNSTNSGSSAEDVTDSSGSGSDGSGSVITIMKTGDVRVKGTVNEQNMANISENMPVIVCARNSDRKWKGTVTKIDRENSTSGQNNGYISDSDSEDMQSSNYPFYVTMDDSDGLMMGQHVYIEEDSGQTEEKQGLWLSSYLIGGMDDGSPYVWKADEDDLLQKAEIQLGEYDEETDQYEVTGGLTSEDRIAVPDDSLKEGMKTSPMNMKEDSDNTDVLTES